MGWATIPLLWAQAIGTGPAASPGGGAGTGLANPAAIASLALRRWCSGLTLSSPQSVPSLDGLWAGLCALGALLILAIAMQGPALAIKQILDIPGHIRLVRGATSRVWRSGRVVAAAITFTVLAWTGSQTLGFVSDRAEKGRGDLTLLTRSRARLELGLDQGILAGLTPLRDLAGLADNLPLLMVAVYLVFRASSGTLPPVGPLPGRVEEMRLGHGSRASRGVNGWSTLIWGSGAIYILYRLVARAAGSVDLPLGGCLVAEAVVVPLLMLVCDGFLLAWVSSELRRGGFEAVGEDRFHPDLAMELMPAAMVACLAVLPARYLATLVVLCLQHLPTSIGSTSLGRYIRWQLGWGLIDLQAAALVTMALAGVVAWSRGSIGDLGRGFTRLLRHEAGHLVIAIAMAGVAAAVLAGPIYPLVLLLPPAGWVLPAADSYAHYLTLPVGLWTLAALIELVERSLPIASEVSASPAGLGGPPEQTDLEATVLDLG